MPADSAPLHLFRDNKSGEFDLEACRIRDATELERLYQGMRDHALSMPPCKGWMLGASHFCKKTENSSNR